MGSLTWDRPNKIADPNMRNFAYSAALANEILNKVEAISDKVSN